MTKAQAIHDAIDRIWHQLEHLRRQMGQYTERLERQEDFHNKELDFLIDLNEEIGQLTIKVNAALDAH